MKMTLRFSAKKKHFKMKYSSPLTSSIMQKNWSNE